MSGNTSGTKIGTPVVGTVDGEVVERYAIDDNGDGAPDRAVGYVQTAAGEPGAGRPAKILFYDDGADDQTADCIQFITYDAGTGMWASFAEDEDGDGDLERRSTYIFEGGVEVRRRWEQDSDGDGDMDLLHTFDIALNRVVSWRRNVDADGDGAWDQAVVRLRDAEGRDIRTTFHEWDGVGELGATTRIEHVTWDPVSGRWAAWAVDAGGDGDIEYRSTYLSEIVDEIERRRDGGDAAAGTLDTPRTIDVDLDGDGAADFTFDGLVRALDDDSDGVPDRAVGVELYPAAPDGVTAADPDGSPGAGEIRRILHFDDGADDLDPDRVVSYEYSQYDDFDSTEDAALKFRNSPDRARMEEDSDGDGIADFVAEVTEWRRDDDESFGLPLLEERRRDDDDDGTVDYVQEIEFRADGTVKRIFHDGNGDGIWDRREFFTLDGEGRAAARFVDEHGSDDPDWAEVYTYDDRVPGAVSKAERREAVADEMAEHGWATGDVAVAGGLPLSKVDLEVYQQDNPNGKVAVDGTELTFVQVFARIDELQAELEASMPGVDVDARLLVGGEPIVRTRVHDDHGAAAFDPRLDFESAVQDGRYFRVEDPQFDPLSEGEKFPNKHAPVLYEAVRAYPERAGEQETLQEAWYYNDPYPFGETRIPFFKVESGYGPNQDDPELRGLLDWRKYYDAEEDGDGVVVGVSASPDREFGFTFDARQRWSQVTRDFDADGVVDRTDDYAYDGDALRPSSITWNWRGPEAPDQTIHITYGTSGNDDDAALAGGTDDRRDWIDGGHGHDRMTGGAGADRFIFRYGDGVDIITDFSAEDGDRIWIREQDFHTDHLGMGAVGGGTSGPTGKGVVRIRAATRQQIDDALGDHPAKDSIADGTDLVYIDYGWRGDRIVLAGLGTAKNIEELIFLSDALGHPPGPGEALSGGRFRETTELFSSRVVLVEHDDNRDGTHTRAEAYEYGAMDLKTKTTWYDEWAVKADGSGKDLADQTIDRVLTLTDGDGDGTAESSRHDKYDDAGELVVESLFDDGHDGAERAESYVYDAAGRATETRFFDSWTGGFGLDAAAADRARAWTYSESDTADRSWLTFKYDNDNDGTHDQIETYTYHAGGELETRLIELDGATAGPAGDTGGILVSVGGAAGVAVGSDRLDGDLKTIGDGTVDSSLLQTFDAAGALLSAKADYDRDGTIDQAETYAYHAGGELAARTAEFDDGSGAGTADDGTVDRSAFEAYGSGGLREALKRDEDHDGVWDRIEAYTHHADGEVKTRTTTFDDGSGAGTDDDGTADRIRLETFAADGQLASLNLDDDADGTDDRIESYVRTFHTGGELETLLTDYDDDADGAVERAVLEAFDVDGRRESVKNDDDDDGTYDKTTAFGYRGTTDKIETRRTEFDDGYGGKTADDGTVDKIKLEIFDIDGVFARAKYDDDADGSWDRDFETRRDMKDAQDRVVLREFDEDADGTYTRAETYAYGAGDLVVETAWYDDWLVEPGTEGAGKALDMQTVDRVRTVVDGDGDGTAESSRTDKYDDEGKLVVESLFDDGDDGTERAESYVYDAAGRTTETRFFDSWTGGFGLADDAADRARAWTYSESDTADKSWLTFKYDNDNDGTHDQIETYAYHANGGLATRLIEVDGGVMNRAGDSGGFAVAPLRQAGGETAAAAVIGVDRLDGGLKTVGDGGVDGDVLQTFDDTGALLSEKGDYDNDGVYDQVDTYAYRAGGGIETRTAEFDDGTGGGKGSADDGTVDRTALETYDANGRLESVKYDNDLDGTDDQVETYTHHAGGGIATRLVKVDGGIGGILGSADDSGGFAVSVAVSPAPVDPRLPTHEVVGVVGPDRLRGNLKTVGDGTADGAVLHSYDENGALLSAKGDFDLDTTYDLAETYTRRADGGLETSAAWFDDGSGGGAADDGAADRVAVIAYDADGRRTSFKLDYNNDGAHDQTETYTHHEDGRIKTRLLELDGASVVPAGDAGGFFAVAAGDRVLGSGRLVGNLKTIGDGTADSGLLQTFSETGALLSAKGDFDGDGTHDLTESYAFHETIDEPQTVDQIDSWLAQLDGPEDPLKTRMREFDDGSGGGTADDGTVDRVVLIAYDKDSQLVESVKRDDDADGGYDRVETYIRAYHSDGVTLETLKIERDDGIDGTVDGVTHETYNTRGQPLSVTHDNDNDGTDDQTETYSYSSNGLPLTWETKFDSAILRPAGDAGGFAVDLGPFDAGDAGGETVPFNIFVRKNLETVGGEAAGVESIEGVLLRTYSGGRLQSVKADYDSNGADDQVETYVYRPVAEGGGLKTLTAEFDDGTGGGKGSGDDGILDRTAVSTFDERGRLASVQYDNDRDGTHDQVETYARHADGWIETRTVNVDGGILGAADDAGGFAVSVAISPPPVIPNAPTHEVVGVVDADHRGGNLKTVGDGTADGAVLQTFDETGAILSAKGDFDLDMTYDLVETYTHHEGGGIKTRTAWFDDGSGGGTADDGIVDRTAISTYDAAGRLVSRERDNNNDGAHDQTEIWTHHEDGTIKTRHLELDGATVVPAGAVAGFFAVAAGRPPVGSGRLEGNLRTVGDGTADSGVLQTFDEAGALLSAKGDFDNDGTYELTETYVYHALDDSGTGDKITAFDGPDGTLKTRTLEFDDGSGGAAADDGTVDRVVVSTYDDKGRLESVKHDNDNDGADDLVETYTRAFHAGSEIVQTLTIERDEGNDGTVDGTTLETYDMLGRSLSIKHDNDNDGSNDQVETYAYNAASGALESWETKIDGGTLGALHEAGGVAAFVVGAAGVPILGRENLETTGDGTFDGVLRRHFGAEGLQSVQADYDGDGTFEQNEAYSYHGIGVLSLRRVRFDDGSGDGTANDGTVDRTALSTFDETGRLVSIKYNDDNEGTLERIEQYEYEGAGAGWSVRSRNWNADEDDVFEYKASAERDASGAVTKETIEFDDGLGDGTDGTAADDGSVDRRQENAYDASASPPQLTSSKYDNDNDGTWDVEDVFAWDPSVTQGPDTVTRTAGGVAQPAVAFIYGGDGADATAGTAGVDWIDAGKGGDTITGGAGADVLIFRPGDGTDIVTDFTAREDRFWVRENGFHPDDVDVMFIQLTDGDQATYPYIPTTHFPASGDPAVDAAVVAYGGGVEDRIVLLGVGGGDAEFVRGHFQAHGGDIPDLTAI